MSVLDAERVVVRAQAAVNRRQRWLHMWQDVIDYMRPGDTGFYQQTPGQEKESLVYDDTAIVAYGDFVSMMGEGIAPPGHELVALSPGSTIPESERARVERELRDVNEYVHEVIWGAEFDLCLDAALFDWGIGTASFLVEADPYRTVRYIAVPLSTCAIDITHDRPDGRFRTSIQTIADYQAAYPQAVVPSNIISDDPTKTEIEVLEATYRDWSDLGTETWVYQHVHPGEKRIMLQEVRKGRGGSPYTTFRFRVSPNEWYGRGPCIQALGSTRTANLNRDLTFENAEFAIAGIFRAPADGVVNYANVQIAPGTVYPYMPGPNARGLESVQSHARFDLAGVIQSEERATIREHFYVEDYSGPGKTPISAEEARSRRMKLFRRVGKPIARAFSEGVIPMYQQTLWQLRQQGRVDLPQVDGREIVARVVSPFANQEQMGQIVDLEDFVASATRVVGPEQAMMHINADSAMQDLRRWYGQPMERLRTRTQREALMEQARRAMATQ